MVTTPDNVNNALTIIAQSSLSLIDYATVRARAGYAIGQFLPYAVIGAAVGRFNYANTVTVHDVGTPPVGSPIAPFDTIDTQSNGKNNAFTAGFVVGLGLDVGGAAERVPARRMGICRLRAGKRSPSQPEHRPRRHRREVLARRLNSRAAKSRHSQIVEWRSLSGESRTARGLCALCAGFVNSKPAFMLMTGRTRRLDFIGDR